MYNLFICVLIFSSVHLQGCDGATPAQVRIEQGILEGELLVPVTGRGQYYSFKGVPFAAPPVGDLRFKAPLPPRKWEGVRNATAHGAFCVQLFWDTVEGDEDCLFLNVYSPDINPEVPMPVIFNIFAGLFEFGSGNDYLYGPDFLMGFGVVLVTINHRLGVFGFLSVDSEDVPGNAGLMDQVAALKWVQENIRAFGGDPDNVTIFGVSSGATSVTLHLVSPAAEGLFKRAIAVGGVLYADFNVCFEHKRRAFELGRLLGTNTTDANDLIDFLRQISPEMLIKTRPIIASIDKAVPAAIYKPVVEKYFGPHQYLTEQPYLFKYRNKSKDVDIMMGQAEMEGTRQVLVNKDWILENYPKRVELFVPRKISYGKNISTVVKLGERVREHYFGNDTVSESTIPSFAVMYSYLRYYYDIYHFVDELIPDSMKNRLYYFIHAVHSGRGVYSADGRKYGIKKTTHRDFIPHLFEGRGFLLPPIDVNSEDFRDVEKVCTLITNFAKFGTPTPDDSFGTIWPVYGKSKNMVEIGENLTVGNLEQYLTEIEFWKELYKEADLEYYGGS